METSDKTIKIVKILNLPVENNQTTEVTVDIDITEDKHSYILENPRNMDCIYFSRTTVGESYKCDYLFVEDSNGKKYTLYDFSYVNCLPVMFYFTFNMILYDGHFSQLCNIEAVRCDTLVKFNKKFFYNICFNCGQLKIENVSVTPAKIFKQSDIYISDVRSKNVILSITGSFNFEEAKEKIYRLSEYIFLVYEELFCYDTFDIYSDNEQYKFIMLNNPKERKRKWHLYTDVEIQNRLVSNPTTISVNGDEFNKFLKFRKDSHFIFDLFKTSVYSDTFAEDYPLRLSQITEGLAKFFKIERCDVAKYGSESKFKIAISSALSKVQNEYNPFNSEDEKREFCDKIKKHRNSFSHAESRGDYLQREENYEYAKILYTTIRILIIKYIRGQLNKSYFIG